MPNPKSRTIEGLKLQADCEKAWEESPLMAQLRGTSPIDYPTMFFKSLFVEAYLAGHRNGFDAGVEGVGGIIHENLI